MTSIFALFPAIQATSNLSVFIMLSILAALFSLIIFLVGIWLRPQFERTWPRLFNKKASKSLVKDTTNKGKVGVVFKQGTTRSGLKARGTLTQFEREPVKSTPAAVELEYLKFEYEYRQQLINGWEKKDFWIAANQQPLPLQREDFFVRPQFLVATSLKSNLTFMELLKTFRHLVLLGVSGAGKTETIIYLLLTFARQQARAHLRLDEKLLPVVLSAPEVVEALSASPELSLSTFLNRQLSPPTDSYVDEKLAAGQLLILLDGLYEISTEPARQVVSWFEVQVEKFPANRFIAVSRPALRDAFRPDGPLTISEFDKLEADALKTLARKWKVLIPEALNILTSITQDEQVYNLARNPLRLHMLLLVGLTTRILPTHRTQLYADYTSVIISGSMREDSLIAQLSDTEKRVVLQKIALTLHKNHQIHMTEQELRNNVREALTALDRRSDEAERLLTERILQSGLITKKNDQYRFAHLSFQEFLTAQSQEIDKSEFSRLLADDTIDPWWQEVSNFHHDLTNTSHVVNQSFTEETKDLLNIDKNQAYTLSLLVQNIDDFEAPAPENGASEKKSEVFDFDYIDPDLQPSGTNGDTDEAVKVMVVDDTPQNIQLARFILQRENYTVMEANNAAEALKLIQEDKPSLILSDIQMPGMDGYEFCRRLKADPTTQNIPFIFVTAFSRSTKEAARGLQIGADDYITRPFAPEELLARIGANVRIHQAEEAARRQATILARRNGELALLNQIQRAVTASLDLDNVLDATMEQVQKVLDAEATSLWFVDRANEALLLSAAFNDSARTIHGIRQPLNAGISGHVVRTGHPYLSGDVQNDPHYQRLATDRSDHIIQSMLCVPLHIRRQVIGVLQAVHHELDHFNQDDLHLFNAVGDAVTVAIENAWLFGQVQLFNQQLEHKVEARTHELAREKEKTETILISIADSLLVTDTANKIIMANRAAEELLDFRLSNVIGSSIEQHEFNTQLWQFVRDINAQPDPTYTATTEVISPANPDKLLSIQAHAAKMWDTAKQVYTGTVIVLRDVTALQEVDRMKARFMTGITHELKTPLAIMTLHIGSLLKYKSLDESKKLNMLQTIQKQANLLERLVENILQLSRLDAGMQIEREPIDLVSLSRQVISELEPLAREKGLLLNFEQTEKEIMIEADPNQLERVIRNLVDNALKYTLEGEITVSLLTAAKTPPYGQAILQVSDTGIGLSSEQVERLFERFYRADPSHNIPGTGLGLSIAKEIAKKHNGDIRVNSKLGKGSTFTVTLPLLK